MLSWTLLFKFVKGKSAWLNQWFWKIFAIFFTACISAWTKMLSAVWRNHVTCPSQDRVSWSSVVKHWFVGVRVFLGDFGIFTSGIMHTSFFISWLSSKFIFYHIPLPELKFCMIKFLTIFYHLSHMIMSLVKSWCFNHRPFVRVLKKG